MPTIIPIRDLRKTSEISEMAHSNKEPIFVTKNGYSDLVIMSAELYDILVKISKIDQVISEAEREVKKGGKTVGLKKAWKKLGKKYYG